MGFESPLGFVLLVGILTAIATLVYFLFRELQQDHETGEYHFTWGCGIVVLFLLGLAPGFVGLGLYLTIQRQYPLYWLVLCLFVVVLIVSFVSYGVYTDIETGVVTTISPA